MTKVAPLAAALAAALLTVGTLTPAQATAADAALTITPGEGSYTGGSLFTLTGSLGVAGRRAIVVQRHMNRPGDQWRDVVNTGGYTRADGSFTITAPASAMMGLSYRVSAGRLASPARMTNSMAQEAILSQATTASVGNAFRLDLDTVGAQFTGYRDLPAPVLAGRGATLQRRVSDTEWADVATTTVGGKGQASFETTVQDTGTIWFRARLDDWTANGDQVGWTTSFPIHVRVYATPRVAASAGIAPTVAPSTDPLPAPSLASGTRRHAADTYGWGRNPRYTYDWEYGESLSSPKYKGFAASGVWAERSDGTGRATMRNGGLLFSSDGYGSAPQGASGDVQVTLKGGGSARLGRWETRGSTTQRSTSGRSYRIRYELVPASQAGQRCASSGIVIAETTGPGGDLTYGVRGPRGGSWARTTTLSSTVGASSFAVQVTKRHITWFLNGSPIGTVRDRAMIPRQRMTVRISMLDVDGSPMKSAKSTVDWVRSYTLKYGKRPTSKKALRKGAAVGGC